MDRDEKIWKFNNNLMMPNINIYINELPTNFILLSFTLHPRYSSSDEQCEIMARVEESARDERGNDVTSSQTLVLRIYQPKTIELDCITLPFTKLLLPNVVYNWTILPKIELPHLDIMISEIRQSLSEVLRNKNFYWEYKDKLGVDLEE